VLGASEGIGAAFAHEFARAGLSVVLVARSRERLTAVAQEIEEQHGVETLVVPCDLASSDAVGRIGAGAGERVIGLVVYNAAAAAIGPFLDLPVEHHLQAVDVNARAVVAVCHRFGGPMKARGRGGIVLMSSLTAFQGTPLVATYGATKAFNLAFAEALGNELEEHGIDVLACCAGATLTPGYRRATLARPEGWLAPKPQEPAEVAREALAALGRRAFVITGRGNRLASFVMRRLLSRGKSVRWIGKEMRRRYAP
jgi:short-subunit dehydrogenase